MSAHRRALSELAAHLGASLRARAEDGWKRGTLLELFHAARATAKAAGAQGADIDALALVAVLEEQTRAIEALLQQRAQDADRAQE